MPSALPLPLEDLHCFLSLRDLLVPYVVDILQPPLLVPKPSSY